MSQSNRQQVIQSSHNVITKIHQTFVNVAQQISVGITSGVLQKLRTRHAVLNVSGYILGTLIQSSVDASKLISLCENYCNEMNVFLKRQSGTVKINDIEAMLDTLTDQVVESMINVILQILSHALRDWLMDPLLGRGPQPAKPAKFGNSSPLFFNESHYQSRPKPLDPSTQPASGDNLSLKDIKRRMTDLHTLPQEPRKDLAGSDDRKKDRRLSLPAKLDPEKIAVNPSLLEKGSAGEFQLARFSENKYNQKIIKRTVRNIDGTESSAYISDKKVFHEKPDHIDDNKLIHIVCDEVEKGKLAHFRSAHFDDIVFPDSRNCGFYALDIENRRLEGETAAQIQRHIQSDPLLYKKTIQLHSVESKQYVLNDASDDLPKAVREYFSEFNKGHGTIYDGEKFISDEKRPNAFTRRTLDTLLKKTRMSGKTHLNSFRAETPFLARHGYSVNHVISDHDIQAILRSGLNKGNKGNLINWFTEIITGHSNDDHSKQARTLAAKLNNAHVDPHEAARLITQLSNTLSQCPYNQTIGNASQNSAIGKSADVETHLVEGKHSLTDHSREILLKLSDDANKDIAQLISRPKISNGIMYSSQGGLGGPSNKHDQDIRLNQLSPRTASIFTKLNWLDSLKRKNLKEHAAARPRPY